MTIFRMWMLRVMTICVMKEEMRSEERRREEEEEEAEDRRVADKNKNPTRRCGELKTNMEECSTERASQAL